MEYLLFRFNKTVKQCVEAPQGGNEELLNAAQAKLSAVQYVRVKERERRDGEKKL